MHSNKLKRARDKWKEKQKYQDSGLSQQTSSLAGFALPVSDARSKCIVDILGYMETYIKGFLWHLLWNLYFTVGNLTQSNKPTGHIICRVSSRTRSVNFPRASENLLSLAIKTSRLAIIVSSYPKFNITPMPDSLILTRHVPHIL